MTLKTQYKNYLKENPHSTLTFDLWEIYNSHNIKQALINMMKEDEDLGLYDEPKQELEILEVPMPIYKQETTSEGFHRIYNSMDFTEFDFVSFKIGVEWQMERSYSEEDMRTAHLMGANFAYGRKEATKDDRIQDFNSWFQKFKKK